MRWTAAVCPRLCGISDYCLDKAAGLCYDTHNAEMRKSNRITPAQSTPGRCEGERSPCEYPSEQPLERETK